VGGWGKYFTLSRFLELCCPALGGLHFNIAKECYRYRGWTGTDRHSQPKMEKIKAYITCPVSHTKERLNLLPEIQKIVESKGIEPFVFIVGGTPEEIFTRDYAQLVSSNLIIAEVSERSHGVGIEVGLSYCLGLKRILLLQKKSSVTKLAQGMPETTIIEYETIDDLKDNLSRELENRKYYKSGRS